MCKKSAIMFVSGCVGVCLFAVGIGSWSALNFWSAAENWEKGKEAPRLAEVPGEDGKMAFSVEYVHAHPFLAEYDKTIVFKSGKRIGVFMDTGGAGPFAVYRLPTGEYYLADGLKHNFIRNDYRVNVTNETVEMMTGDTFWIRIPDGTLAVVGSGGDSISVTTADEACKNVEGKLAPVGDSLSRRKYLGLVHPRGAFEKSSDCKDPYAGIIELEWTAVDAGTANLPFALEWRDSKNGWNRQWRIATATGKHFGLVQAGDFVTCTISVGAPGVYRLRFASKNGRGADLFDNEYRIDANSEKVEMIVGGFLLSIPSGTVGISSFGLSEGRASLTATCENGTQIESDESVPASEDKYQYMLVGDVGHDGSFRQCR
ncbi:MAG: hypothetical protein J6V72_02325 [Kiritimatiellae bacterium]|nr:hypothetical protein [Kiritimatiellia bacterium]